MDEYGIEYTQYQAGRSRLRKLVRKLYLRKAASQISGPTLDFGCGIGELLSILPPGSAGLEYNRETVAYCQSRGLDVNWYDGFSDDWALSAVPAERTFESMTISHVLEHLDAPVEVLRSLMGSAERLGIRQLLIIVPGPAGYRSDATHRTFVDLPMLRAAIAPMSHWQLINAALFPLNVAALGNVFPHHELQVLLERG